MKRLLSVLTLLGGLAFSASAHATTFNIDISGTGASVFGSGVITATSVSPTAYRITALSGPNITGLFGVGDFDGNDNLIYPTSTDLFDSSGFAFTYMDSYGNTYNADVYENSNGEFAYVVDEDNYAQTVPVSASITFVPTPTPEPSSFILFGTGLLGMMFLLRRRSAATPGPARRVVSQVEDHLFVLNPTSTARRALAPVQPCAVRHVDTYAFRSNL